MNRDDIIRMAREHLVMNLTQSEYTEFGWQECHRYEFDDDELLHFAALVAAAEREACALVCESTITPNIDWWNDACQHCATAIRARGEV